MSEHDNNQLIDLAAMVVAAYVAHNNIARADLPPLIESTHAALAGLGIDAREPPALPLVPAVSIRKSVTPDAIICLEDGSAFKSLKRHLRAKYDMTPEQYRAKWGLPGRLSDGCAQLCRSAFGHGQVARLRPQTCHYSNRAGAGQEAAAAALEGQSVGLILARLINQSFVGNHEH